MANHFWILLLALPAMSLSPARSAMAQPAMSPPAQPATRWNLQGTRPTYVTPVRRPSATISAIEADHAQDSLNSAEPFLTDDLPQPYSQTAMQYEPATSVPATPADALPPGIAADESDQFVDEPAVPKPWILPYGGGFTSTVTAAGKQQLGVTDLDGRVLFGSPRLPGWFLTAGYGAHLWSGNPQIPPTPLGETSLTLPDAVHDVYIELMTMKKINDRLSVQVAAAPGLYTDFENTSSDAFRITGRALAFWKANEQLTVAFGAIYLGRDDIKALPAAGLTWKISDDSTLELMFPKPRWLRKIRSSERHDHWFYVGGEFGGGSWAISRTERRAIVPNPAAIEVADYLYPDDDSDLTDLTPAAAATLLAPAPAYLTATVDDVATYSALRLMAGFEARPKSGRGVAPRLEAGWVFNRSIELKSTGRVYDLDGAFFARFGVNF